MLSERPYLNVYKKEKQRPVNFSLLNFDQRPLSKISNVVEERSEHLAKAQPQLLVLNSEQRPLSKISNGNYQRSKRVSKPQPQSLVLNFEKRPVSKIPNVIEESPKHVTKPEVQLRKVCLEKEQRICCGRKTRLAKKIYTFFITILFFYDILLLTNFYFKYGTTIKIVVDIATSLEKALPGVTICDKNRIRLDAAFKYIKGLRENITEIDRTHRNSSTLRKAARLNSLMHFMKLYFRKYLIKHQLEDGPDLNKFIEQLSCSENHFEKSEKLMCENMERIVSAQGKGNCVTMFHAAAIIRHKERRNRVNQSPVVSIASSETNFSRFVPLEVIKVKLNFDPDSYTDLRDTAAAELMIHDERSVPLMASLSYPLRPGHLYEIFIKKTSVESLPSPYTTHCRNYFDQNVHFYRHNKRNFIDLSHPLSRTHCIENCIAERAVSTCRCWPLEIPYWANNPLDHRGAGKGSGNKGLNWCDWHDSKNGDNYEKCFHKPSHYCRRACRKDCVRDYYEVFEQAVKWPSMEKMWTTNNKMELNRLKKDTNCCALVSIRYTSLTTSVIRHQPRLTFSDLLGKYGGLMSIFVGTSIISIYDLFQRFIHNLIATHISH